MVESIKLCISFSPLPCCTCAMLLKKSKIFQRILVYLLQALTRPHSFTWVTKRFKGLIACAKYNRDSYDNELGSKVLFLFCLRTSKS